MGKAFSLNQELTNLVRLASIQPQESTCVYLSIGRIVDTGICNQLPGMGVEGSNAWAASTPETEPLHSSLKISFL